MGIFSFRLRFRHIILRTLTITQLAFRRRINRRLRFCHCHAFSLTFFTASTFHIRQRVTYTMSRLLNRQLINGRFTSFIVHLSMDRQVASKELSSEILIRGLSIIRLASISFR